MARRKKDSSKKNIVSIEEHKSKHSNPNIVGINEHKNRLNTAMANLEQKKKERQLRDEQKRREEQEAERERVKRQNDITLSSVFGTPAALQPKKELTDKLGQYKTNKGALSGYMEYLKEKNQKNDTMTGLKQQGPVVDAQRAISNYKKQAEEKKKKQEEENKKSQLRIQAAYGTPAALQPNKELTEKLGQYKTQQSALNNYLKDLNKRKSTMSGLPWDGPVVEPVQAAKQYEKNQVQKWQQEMQKLMEKQKKVSGSGHERWESNKAEIGTPSISSFNTMNAGRMEERDQGIYDISGNPTYVSNAELDNIINTNQITANERRTQAEEARLKGRTGLFDYIENIQQYDLENILRGNYTPEEKARAVVELRDRKSTYNDRRIKAAETDPTKIVDPGVDADMIINQLSDAAVFNLVTGEDYSTVMGKLNDEQKRQMNSLISETRENFRNHSWKNEEAEGLNREADAYDYQARQALVEKATRGKIKDFLAESRRYDQGVYDPSLVETQEWFDEMLTDPIQEPIGSREDKAYYYLNNRPEEGDPGNSLDYLRKEYFALPEWVDAYNAFYREDKENGTNQAGAFLDAIDPYLTSWCNEYIDDFIREKAENPWTGIPMRIMSYPINAVNSIPSLINTGLAMLGNKEAADPNKGVNLVNKITTTSREEQNKDIANGNEAVEYMLGIADSIGDNIMAMGTSGAVTGNVASNAGKALVQLIMSGEATGHTFLEKLEEKKDPTEAALYAIGDGIIEWFTEEVSLEALLKPDVKAMLGKPKEIAKFIAKTTAAEGSEEIASDFLNWGLDYILSMAYDHEDELKARYYDLVTNGNMSDKDAWKQALTEKYEQIGLSGLAGAISGGLMGAGRVGTTSINQQLTGRATRNNQINGMGGTEALLQLANEAKGEMGVAQAQEIQQKIENGEKVTNKAIGKLAQTIQYEASERLHGENNKIGDVLDQLDTLRSVAEITGKEKPASETNTDMPWAKPEEVNRLEQEGKQRIAGNREVVYYDEKTGEGSFGKIESLQVVRNEKENRWELKLKLEGKTEPVEASRVQLTDYNASKIIYNAKTNPAYYSAEYTQALLDAAEKGQFSNIDKTMDKQLRDAQLVRLYAYAGKNADELELKYLPKEVQDQVWAQSAKEHGDNRLAQVKEAGRQTNPKIQYKGTEYGTKAWNKLDLDRNIKNQMDVIAGIAQRAGVSVDFADLEDEKLYGSENKRTKLISINVNGMNFDTITGERTGTRHHMLVTFGHEFTHWMQQHSLAGYNRLEQYVLNSLINEKGVFYLKGIVDSYASGDERLNIEDAISEIVAQASDAVLMDEDVIRHIQETDSKLYNNIKGFVKDLVGKLKKAIQLMPESRSSISQVMAKYANELNKLWMGAYDEALKAKMTEANAESAETDSRKSVAELSDGTRIAIEDNNLLDQIPEGMKIHEFIFKYLTDHINDSEISEATNDVIYLGNHLPREYTHSQYTLSLIKGSRNKLIIKERAAGVLLDAIVASDNKQGPFAVKHKNKNAKQGIYKYNTKIAFPVKNASGDITNYNVYSAQMIVNRTSSGKFELYDIIDINKDDQSALKLLNESAVGTINMIRQPKVAYNSKLSQNDQNSNTRKSRAQLDNDYMAAVESGDEETQIRIIDEAAQRAGFSDLAYHGTKMFGFTNFDMNAGQGMAFVAYNVRLAKSYTTAGELRNISSRTGVPVNYYTMNDKDLAEYVKDIFNRWGMMGVTSVRKIEGGKNKSDIDLFEVKHQNEWEKEETISKYRRFELYQALEEYTNPNAELDGIYQLYTKPKNQLVIDAEGKLWNEIPFDLYGTKVIGIDNETYEYTDTEWDDDFDPDEQHDLTASTREIAKWAKAHGYDSVRINNVSDNGGRNIELYNEGAEQVYGDIGIFFNEKDIKSADPVVYDDNGDVIPPSERFNDEKTDIRWSRALTEEQQAEVDEAEENGIDLDPVNQTAGFYYSRASFERSEYYKDPNKMARMLAKNVLGSQNRENVAKAKKWIADVTSISAMIAERPEILDYIASPGRSSFKSNPEYGGSIDSSTICAKRRLQTGTLDAIQRALPDYAMTAEDFLRVRRMMKDRGYEVSCGLCFVESSRKNIAKYAKQFMNEWNSEHPDNKVNMVQINTVLGLEDTRINNKEVYAAYEKFMNKLAQRKPKLFEMRSEYDNDIIKHFKNDDSVEAKNKNGGMRINSFSDFEIVHLIDMMQVIMDMSNVGLAGQAYTKVRQFAEALGPTGLKINMSMIAAGVDENGRIIFDEVEGMKWDDVKDLRDKYADNVGTVCVVFTEDQLMAAMADDRIDFIIPFHRSQWNKSNYKDIGLPENVKDFTYWQNERYREPVYGKKKDGTLKKLRAANYMPNEYWDFKKSGKENAEAYLQMCKENNKIPKFWKWLQSNGDGSFSLKEDGSTDGYWKLLIDFKMYNHLTQEGKEQLPVKPEFDMDASQRMLREYKGGHESFPEASDVVQDFVKEKKEGRKGLSTGKNGRVQLAGNEIGESRLSRWTESAMDVNYWMEHVTPSALQTEDEWKMVQAYRGKRTSMALSLKKQLDMKAQIRTLEGKTELTSEQRDELIKLRNNLKTEQDKYARLEDELFEITSDSGWAGIMRQHNVVFRDYMEGKTQEQVQASIDTLTEEVKRQDKEIAKQEKALKKMEEESAVQTVKKLLARKGLARTAAALRSEYTTAMSEEELKNRLAEIVIKNAQGEDITADVEALAADVITNQTGMANEVADEQLYPMRGMTVELSPAQMKELKAKGSSLAELRRRTHGSGIRFVEGERFTLESNIGEIIDENPALRDKMENAGNSLDNFVDYVEGLLKLKQQQAADNIDQAELEAFIAASANMMLNENAGGMNRTQLTDAIRKEAGRIGQALEAVRGVKESIAGMKAAGAKAQSWAGVLNEDTQQALKYYNKMARLAAETERKRVKQTVIESLKSEHAKKMLEQAEKFREQIANDKKARELAEDNAALRQKVSTVATRMANRIFAETDQKNVPEETKGLVRQVLDMISKFDAYSEDGEGFLRKVTYWDKQKVENVRLRLMKMMANYGQFDPDTDLDWLVVKAADPADNDYTVQDAVINDLINIEAGLLEYRNAEGQGRISLADRKAALEKVQEAISEIWDVIQARSELEIAGRKMQVYELAEVMRDEMQRSRFKGERTGFGTRARNTISGGVTWGNLTPEYFFKNLKNRAMEMLHRGLKDAENRSGLEAARAKARLAQIAEENGFAKWDGQEEHKVQTRSGEITMTTEQIMALYATWLRESNQMRPEDTAHLLHGGFVLAEKENKKGLPGREKRSTRPIRMSKANLDALGEYLTDEQKQYVQDMVAYMSGELAELGNEASMKMYGIKKFTEQFYFPIKSWGGVLNKRSDAGISSNNENRAAQQGFSKRIKNNAANAIEIGDFTPTAIKHVAGMITYNTVGPAIENMNKVLNQQLQYGNIEYTEAGEEEDNTYKMNLRAAFENAYGKQASDYLAKFMKDMNGGVTTERTPFDKLLSLFKKNAVAGSLSVAAQQPLSYIRAAMMINPKYLAAAISPQYWKGSYAEMMKHSGVAVIKEMGKFDMNFGQTMQEWITPEGMESKARKAWNKTTDLVTGLPGAMDMMTWTRMWTAVKLEQMAENKGADFTSDEFMAKVAERFNELMRRTQVYDSVMTKSQNMRSTHFYAKTLTSFMAEPTLSLNVLADAFQNMKEKGGKLNAAKAVATFLLSAAAQAGAKAFFGAGRTPDKKKNKEENFLNKFWYNLLSEANPFGLIPGYRQIVETMTDGEFKDDTMGMIAKAGDVVDRIWKLATGEIGQKGLYRDLEDSIGQFLQLTTDIPAKNMMRDFRAMVNWFSGGTASGFTGDSYAQRETSKAVLKYQLIDNLMSNDIMGLVNKKLDDAGYKTTNAAYYDRLYAATASGNTQAAEEIKDYLINGKGVSEKTIQTQLGTRINQDDSLSGPEKVQQKLDNGASVSSVKSWITQNYKQAYIDADTDGRRQLMNELTKMYKLLGISGDDAMKTVTKWVKDEKKKDGASLKNRAIGFIGASGVSDSSSMNREAAKPQRPKNDKEWDKYMDELDEYWAEYNFDRKDPVGQKGKGNIDLNNRETVENEDGSISTEFSFSFWDDKIKKEVLIPRVVDGKIVSEREAKKHYYKTGEYLGMFDDWHDADEYALMLHNRQDWYYNR